MSSETGVLQFSEWDTGRRKLRFMFLCSPCSFKLCPGNLEQDNMIPLFLGTDVVAHTGIRTENHPKLHAKFAKKGLATKLQFTSDFRFEKLRLPNTVNSLWFYSIQGVFRVAFDLYNREDQLAVIDSLQDLWKTRLKDGPLSKGYNLKTFLANSDYMEQSLDKEETPALCDQHETNMIAQSIPVLTSVTGEHNYCVTDHCDTLTGHSPEARGNDLVFHKIQSVLDIYMNVPIDLNEQLRTTVLMLINIIELIINGQQFLDTMTESIVQLLDTASYVFARGSLPEENLSVYDNSFLLEVSSWLGRRFQSENECISQQVEEFKRKHIDRISDLPPAEELIAALFPKAMKVLLINWMGLNGEASLAKLQSEYPILLLILEFANRNLITGVAHVLYSTLICK
ncbi:uncharacterized protein O3C94_007645 [Discoglossus pictus]